MKNVLVKVYSIYNIHINIWYLFIPLFILLFYLSVIVIYNLIKRKQIILLC